MKHKKQLVAFIDILGFKKLIDDYFSGKDTSSLTLLKQTMKEAEVYAIDYSKRYLKQFDIKFSFRQFSDCISISIPLNRNHATLTTYGAFINVVRIYQLMLLENNFLVRGGIALGGHFENSNMIFSEALVKAYKLENQNAVYPRIIIDKELIHLIEDALNNNPDDYNLFYELYGKAIIIDWDDEVFISPFGMLEELKSLGDIYGEEELIKMIESYAATTKIEIKIPDNFVEQLKSLHGPKEIIKPLLKNINKYLKENTELNHEILSKYKWLKQFMVWSITPRKSKIKFEYYFFPKQ